MFVGDQERYVLDTAVARDRLKIPWQLKASTIMEEALDSGEQGEKAETAAMREAILKGQRYVFSKPYTDPVYGQFLTGSAPVLNSSGQVVGALNVDFSLETLNDELDGIRAGGMGALSVAILVSLLGGTVYARTRASQDRALAERNEALIQRQKTASDLENLLDKMIGAFSLQEMIYDAVGTPSDHRFLKVNAAFERMTGLKGEEVTGRTAREVFGRVDEDLTLTYGRVVLSGEPRNLERRDVKTGRWYEVTAYRAGEHQFACHYVDVTERHNAQEEVALNEERYRIAAMATGQVVYDLDVATGVVAWEGAVEQVLGCRPEKAKKIDQGSWEAMIHEEDRARVKGGLVRAREECGAFRAEYRLLRKDGGTAVVEETGVFLPGPDKRAVRMIGAMNDVTQARAMEKALRDSESRFRRLAENSMDMIALFDQDGAFVYVSPASLRITGYAPEELVGRRGDSFAHEEDAAAFVVALGQEASEPGARTCVWRFRRRNGRYIWLEMVAQRCTDSGGSPARTVAVSRDMTDRMRSEAMLKTQHALALRLADADVLGPALEAALDAVTAIAPGCAVNVYLRCQEQKGFELAASRGVAPEQMAVARAFGVASAMIRTAGGGKPTYFRAGDPVAKELIGDREVVGLKEGAIIPLAPRGRVLGILTIASGEEGVFDGSARAAFESIGAQIGRSLARVEAEEALRRSEQRFRTIVDALPQMICLVGRGRRCLFANQAWETQFGPAHGQDLGEALGREMCEAMASQLDKALHGEAARFYQAMDRSGEKRFMSVALAPEPERGDGQLRPYYIVLTDVTTLKDAEDQKAILQKQLYHSQKLESVGRLAGGVAHDFNNLLTGIMGSATLAMMEAPKGSSLCETLTDIMRTAESAATLTRQLLLFSRKQTIEPQIVDMNDLIVRMERMLNRLIGEDVELRVDHDGGTNKVRADPGQLEQVVVNLVVNARDAMPQGGDLTIGVRRVALAPEACQGRPGVMPGEYVELSVSDTGCGMSDEVKEKMFEPFFTTKDSGTGLGLATVYGAVRQNNGAIEVDTAPGKGTRFRILFPLVSEAPAAGEEIAPPTPAATGETVLLVEDDPLVRGVALICLQRQGYDVIACASGAEALAIVASRKEPIDLLLTDVVMPGMSGPELAQELRRVRPKLRVLFASGYAGQQLPKLGNGAGFVSKPFSPSALTAKVRLMLDGA